MNDYEETCENPDTCIDEECAEHGYLCGACGSYITEEAEKGDGEGRYHGRNESCYAHQILTF